VALPLACSSALANSTSSPPPPPPPAPPAPAVTANAPLCVGEYAEDWATLSAEALATDSAADKKYSYCVRNTAVYECISYASDGSLKKTRRNATLHGTAFGYRRDDGDTLLLTNQHVAEWPSVTDDEHPVEGVPLGCKKVNETLKLVDDE